MTDGEHCTKGATPETARPSRWERMRLSDLLRQIARLLCDPSVYVTAAQLFEISDVLTARAAKLVELRNAAIERCSITPNGAIHRLGCACHLLEELGEVPR